MFIDLTQLPDWLFLKSNEESTNYVSSTTGVFSPTAGLDSTQKSPWTHSIPTAANQQTKKTIVITDFTLADPSGGIEEFLKKLGTLELLLRQGFQIYVIRDGIPLALSIPINPQDLTQASIPSINLGEAANALAPIHASIDADHIALCDCDRLENLVDILNMDERQPEEKKEIRMRARQDAFITHYINTQSFPTSSHPITIDTRFLNQLNALGIRDEILDGEFQYDIPSDAEKNIQAVNPDKIVSLSLNKQPRDAWPLTPAHLKKLILDRQENPEFDKERDERYDDFDHKVHHFLKDAIELEEIRILNNQIPIDSIPQSIKSIYVKNYLGRVQYPGSEIKPMLKELHFDAAQEMSHKQLYHWLIKTPNLRSLTLTKCPCVEIIQNNTDIAVLWNNLNPLNHLTHLDFTDSRIHGATLYELLKKTPQLKSLKLGKQDSPNEFNPYHIELKQLTELDMSQSCLSNVKIQLLLQKTPLLTSLTLQANQLFRLSLGGVSLEHLTTLNVHGSGTITSSDLENFLRKTPNLKSLNIKKANFFNEGTWDNISLNQLTELNLSKTSMTENTVIALLKKTPNLILLTMPATDIEITFLSEVHLPHLKFLRSAYADQALLYSDIYKIQEINKNDYHMENFKTMEFKLKITDKEIECFICARKNMRKIKIVLLMRTDTDWKLIPLNHLVEIDITNTNISSQQFSALINNAPHVRKISLNGFEAMGNLSIITPLNHLTSLNFDNSIQSETVISLIEKAPNLKLITLQLRHMMALPDNISIENINELIISNANVPASTLSEQQTLEKMKKLLIKMPKLKSMTSTLSSENLDKLIIFIQENREQFKFPDLLINGIEKTIASLENRESNLIPIHRNEINGDKKHWQIYTSLNKTSTNTSLNTSTNQATYKMTAVCSRIDGKQSQYHVIRSSVYVHHHYPSNPNTPLINNDIDPEFSDNILKATHKADHVFDYPANPNDFQWSTKYKKFLLRLKSLTPEDRLTKINTDPVFSNSTIEYSTSDNFYYLVVDQQPTDTVQLTYEVATPLTPRPIANLPDNIKALYKQFNQYFDTDPNATHLNTMEYIRDHAQYYRCGVRASAFLYFIEKQKIAGITSCRISQSGEHGWIELQYQNEWYTLDLGGAPSKIEYLKKPQKTTITSSASTAGQSGPSTQRAVSTTHQSQRIPPKTSLSITAPATTSKKKRTKPSRPKILDENTLNTEFQQPGKNTLFVFNSQEELEKARSYLCTRIPGKIISMNTPSELQTNLPFIALDQPNHTWEPFLPSGGWLKEKLENAENTHLLINWSRFSPRETAQNNTCIDTKARFVQETPIAKEMHVVGLILKDDPRLDDPSFKRRHQKRIFDVDCPLPFFDQQPFPVNVDPIELYESSQWMDLLLGKTILDGDVSKFVPGTLLAMLKGGSKNLVIRNPPKNSMTFNRFIEDLRNGHPIRFLDQTLQFPPMSITFQYGYDFTERVQCIENVVTDVTTNHLPAIDYVLTPATFERCLHNHQVIDKTLTSDKGWIVSHSHSEISFYITRTLSIQQYCALLDEAKHKKLHLYLAPGVRLPAGLNVPVPKITLQAQSTPTQATLCITNNHDDFICDQCTKDDIIIDVSELSSDDVLYEYVHHFNKDNKKFTFDDNESGVLAALKSGKKVYLTGKFSSELIDHLSSLLIPGGYVWQENQKKSFKGQLFLVPEGDLPELSWMTQRTHHEFAAPSTSKEHFDAHEPEDAQEFQDARKNAIKEVLIEHKHPAVLIEGPPGIGENSLIQALKKESTYQFFSEEQLEEWASTPGTPDKIPVVVFRDTLRTKFKGLYAPRPHLLINKKITYIEDKKIIFLRNTVEDMPALFQKKVPSLHLKPLSRDYIIKNILNPIFSVHSPDTAENEAKIFFERNTSPTDTHFDERDLQAKAIAHCAAKNPKHDPQQPPVLKDFYLTHSRRPILGSIIEILNARHFMANAPKDKEAARFGGKTALGIEGPAGIGKTELVTDTLKALGYKSMTDVELDDNSLDISNRYIEISPSDPPELLMQRIRQSVQKGALVVIHELDTALTLEMIAEINASLMGDTLSIENQKNAGFGLIFTCNGKGFTGRTALPQSLRSCSKMHDMGQYADDECLDICQDKFKTLDRNIIIDRIAEGEYDTFDELIGILKIESDKMNRPPVTTIPVTSSSIIDSSSVDSSSRIISKTFMGIMVASMITAAFTPDPFYENMDTPIGPLFTLGIAAFAIGLLCRHYGAEAGTPMKNKKERTGDALVVIGVLSLFSAAVYMLIKMALGETDISAPEEKGLAMGLYGVCAFSGIVSGGFEAKNGAQKSRTNHSASP